MASTQAGSRTRRTARSTEPVRPSAGRRSRTPKPEPQANQEPAREPAHEPDQEPDQEPGFGGLVQWTELPIVHTRVPVPRLAQTASGPTGRRILYYGGLGLLAAVGMVEWPVAAAIGAGVWVATHADHQPGDGRARPDQA